jgi:hypothetical protein
MFKYDSTHGKYHGDVVGGSEGLFINGKKIASYSKMCAALPGMHPLRASIPLCWAPACTVQLFYTCMEDGKMARVWM